jgi:hypothetical protein
MVECVNGSQVDTCNSVIQMLCLSPLSSQAGMADVIHFPHYCLSVPMACIPDQSCCFPAGSGFWLRICLNSVLQAVTTKRSELGECGKESGKYFSTLALEALQCRTMIQRSWH